MATQGPLSTWRSFLHNHMRNMATVDMFVVATATFRLLYALIVLGHDRRRIIHFEVTQNPTQVWLARQLTEAFPWDTAPRYLLRDRDASYGQTFRDASRRWQSRRSSLPRDHPGRIPTSSASLARSGVNVSITSSSSTSVTCAKCCHHISSIIARSGRIFRSTRIVRTPGQYSNLLPARSSRSPRSEDCIIATNAAPPKLPS